MRFFRISISLLMLAATAWIVSRDTDWSAVGNTLTQVSPAFLCAAIIALIGGALVAVLRMQWIASDLGYKLTFRDAMAGFTYGQVMGAIFFQLAGQLLARSTVLSRRAVPPSATIVITGYERLVALAISLLLALVATLFLFGSISLDYFQGGSSFIRIAVGGTLVLAGGALFVWGNLLRTRLPPITGRTALGLLRNASVSLAIQLLTMAAYVLLAHALAPAIPVTKLAAASALVMFAASLPISLAGWGIREMSAIYVLSALGVPANVSFVIALLIGILSLAVVAALATVGLGETPAEPSTPRSQSTPAVDYAALLDATLPVLAATAVYFQLFVPVKSGLISVNLADPVVMLAGCIFIYNHVRQAPPRWRLDRFNAMVLLASLVMVAGYLRGYFQFGFTPWAFTNRLIGWPILLGYAATGALIVNRMRADGLDLLLRTFVATGLIIFLLENTLVIAYWSGASVLQPLVHFPMEGFSQNRNIFCLQLIFVISALLATQWPYRSLLLGIAIAGVVITGSRAGYIALAVVLMLALWIAAINWRQLMMAAVIAVLVVAASELVPVLVQQIAIGAEAVLYWVHALWPALDTSELIAAIKAEFSSVDTSGYFVHSLSEPASNVQRIASMLGGWQLFLQHPFIGAGLGAFMDEQTRQGTPLVIHSTPLWLLAEFGLIGFALLAAPIILIFRSEILKAPHFDVAGRLLLLAITGFAVMSLFHELLYQRAFWLLLGAAMAMPFMAARRSERQMNSETATPRSESVLQG